MISSLLGICNFFPWWPTTYDLVVLVSYIPNKENEKESRMKAEEREGKGRRDRSTSYLSGSLSLSIRIEDE